MDAAPLANDATLTRVRLRYVDAVRDALEQYDDRGARTLLVVKCVLLALTVVLLPAAIVLALRARRHKGDDIAARLREHLRFAEAAVPVMAYPLMVNSILRAPGDRAAPALVLAAIPTAPGRPPAPPVPDMIDLAQHLMTGGGPGWSASDRAFAARLFADEQHQPFRRRRLPDSLTGGAPVYACDLGIVPQLLYRHHVSAEFPFLPCMAERGDAGRIWLMPYWMLPPEPLEPSPAERQAFFGALLAFSNLRRATKG